MGKGPAIPTVASLNNEFITLTKPHCIWGLHESKVQEFPKGVQRTRTGDIRAAPLLNISAKKRVDNPYFQITFDAW